MCHVCCVPDLRMSSVGPHLEQHFFLSIVNVSVHVSDPYNNVGIISSPFFRSKRFTLFLPWQTCSFRHQLDFSGKHSSHAAITREDYSITFPPWGERKCLGEVQESKTEVVWPRKETRTGIRQKKDSGDGTTWEKKKRKTEAEMDGLCQSRHESHRNDERLSPWQNWLEENCVCRSDPTAKWEQLEEEEEENENAQTLKR